MTCRARAVRMLFLGQDIAPLVVGIGICCIVAVAAAVIEILADKLICGIVRI